MFESFSRLRRFQKKKNGIFINIIIIIIILNL